MNSKALIITRGVPGSGKTSFVENLVEEMDKTVKHVVITRDDVRLAICKEWLSSNKYYISADGSPISVEELYQYTFKNDYLNRKIKRKYWRFVSETLNDGKYDIVIIDSCFLSTEDIVMMKTILDYCPKYFVTIYEFTKEYGSEHSVPESVMKEYRRKVDPNRDYAARIADKYIFVK